MKDLEKNIGPALVAVAVVAGVVVLAWLDHGQVAVAVATIGIVVQAFMKPVVAAPASAPPSTFIPPPAPTSPEPVGHVLSINERDTDPEGYPAVDQEGRLFAEGGAVKFQTHDGKTVKLGKDGE